MYLQELFFSNLRVMVEIPLGDTHMFSVTYTLAKVFSIG